MAVKLAYMISQSNFETIRDVIAVILKEEIDNQALLHGTGDPVVPHADYLANFYTERFTPIDKSEGNVITVDVAGGNLNDQTALSQVFECNYNIDIFTSGIEIASQDGYLNSSVKVHRFAGMVRHILQSPYYVKLGLDTNIIGSRSVNQIQFARVDKEQDASYMRMARVTLNVKMNESSNEVLSVAAAGYDTRIKIEETEKGYYLTYNNN